MDALGVVISCFQVTCLRRALPMSAHIMLGYFDQLKLDTAVSWTVVTLYNLEYIL